MYIYMYICVYIYVHLEYIILLNINKKFRNSLFLFAIFPNLYIIFGKPRATFFLKKKFIVVECVVRMCCKKCVMFFLSF
ncbi:hypothetical protein GLOIN_2v856783 [Rhizophagus irregularis DAOM 181602=DAOM 197198]|uniref:Uncharacterized protein n=1 Tax=Rhizophagus irregularis (strain DAOM 181602 / DAOM 197198 / MUCL 43194) TaxID=747089 RepID=A0A2P4P1B5_RHIID|nr:hypothetical protein GLOIN_2v856783 [Rhizophagus irregularis DAOM 181602=DAOM 197198]POG59171.1 hypothetical protein GLOIN_2v856783 [Rhizophagus irregularis DAOM 181602=DAOM 197198]GET63984.1 hypothetical protein GLOIN_2v856783 [Rhizophagus irregularis DAOM 181602=DAOM 197198]|eukprot:XP_025166037.1 hypothetical protein GLOIN_2v856783 [Rhizophagus irregularis DAOM 181602=DAOM 197198]